MVGVSPSTVRHLAATTLATSGDPDLFVCATPQRVYDTVENQVLVAALESVRDAARSVDGATPTTGADDDRLRRARHNGMRAVRYLEHRTLSAVASGHLDGRMVRRARRGTKAKTYGPAVAMVDRASEPLTPEHVLALCDPRTTAQHQLLLAIAERLEERGATLPELRADQGVLYSGPMRYLHPRGRAGQGGLHGILLGQILVDVPDRPDATDRSLAQADLDARSSGRPAVVVLDDRDVTRAVDAAVEAAKG